MSDKKLTGEIAIVTGSDSGIGQATAIALAREGANLAITYLEDEQGAKHTKKLVEGAGQKALISQLDQTQPEQIEQYGKPGARGLENQDVLVCSL